MSACPPAEELDRLLAGDLDESACLRWQLHLDGCAVCRDRLEQHLDVPSLVPREPSRWPDQPASSASLSRVIAQLQAEGGDAADPPLPPAPPPAAALALLEPTDQPGFLGRLGGYEVRGVIGQGGMGVVLEAVDPVLKRTVALKMLSPWTVLDEPTRGRFLREAQAAAALAHENVVTIFDVDEVGGMPILVLEHVPGESLESRLKRTGKLSVEECVRLGADIARGLGAAHANGLVHRDIKPANILLSASTGRAKIADFGLAKASGEDAITLAGTLLGTPEFMSPEQAAGRPAGERSDLFSLGAVLYVAASGVSPFRGGSLLETLDNVRRSQPRPLAAIDPTLPKWLCDLVHRLLARDPHERPGSAAEVAQMLERTSSSPAVAVAARKPAGAIRRWWPAAAALSVLGLLALTWWLNRGSLEDEEPTTTAPSPDPLGSAVEDFAIAGLAQRYPDLAAAVEAAQDRDTIEVRGNGPYLTPPLRVVGKRLRIRAAAGAAPVLLMQSPTARSIGPLVRSDSELCLEGLEIHWSIDGDPGFSEGEMIDRSTVAVTHGRLLLAHCRIVSDRFNVCAGSLGREVIVRNCHLVAKDGLGVFWRAAAGGSLAIEASALECRAGASLLVDGVALGSTPATFQLANSTVAADRLLQVFVETVPRQPLPFLVRRSVIDADYLCVFGGQRLARPKTISKLDDVVPVLRALADWTEEANVYRRGIQFVARPVPGRPGSFVPAGIVGMENWLTLLGQPEAGSVEGQIIYEPRIQSAATSPLVLKALNEASGTPPDGVGPPEGQVGPGNAYHDWRNSADYAAWPPAASP